MIPSLFDPDDAVRLWAEDISDAIRAYIVNFLTVEERLSNKQIRELLNIRHVYVVTHLRLAGSISEDEILLWDRNCTRVTLSHMRAIACLAHAQRKNLLEKMLVKRIPSKKIELLVKDIKRGIDPDLAQDFDIKKYAEDVSETIGRPVSINFDTRKKSGEITLKFFSVDDLSNISSLLGYKDIDDF